MLVDYSWAGDKRRGREEEKGGWREPKKRRRGKAKKRRGRKKAQIGTQDTRRRKTKIGGRETRRRTRKKENWRNQKAKRRVRESEARRGNVEASISSSGGWKKEARWGGAKTLTRRIIENSWRTGIASTIVKIERWSWWKREANKGRRNWSWEEESWSWKIPILTAVIRRGRKVKKTFRARTTDHWRKGSSKKGRSNFERSKLIRIIPNSIDWRSIRNRYL